LVMFCFEAFILLVPSQSACQGIRQSQSDSIC
jgi:hypothetical protein